MIVESIILVIFIISFGAVLLILARKIPDLISLSQNGSAGIENHKLVVSAKDRIKSASFFFERQIFFHKFLSWVKVMTLKIETKVDNLLQKIRNKNQKTPK